MKDKFIKMLEDSGYEKIGHAHGYSGKFYSLEVDSDGSSEVMLGEGKGYNHFYVVFCFDIDGLLIGHAVYE